MEHTAYQTLETQIARHRGTADGNMAATRRFVAFYAVSLLAELSTQELAGMALCGQLPCIEDDESAAEWWGENSEWLQEELAELLTAHFGAAS